MIRDFRLQLTLGQNTIPLQSKSFLLVYYNCEDKETREAKEEFKEQFVIINNRSEHRDIEDIFRFFSGGGEYFEIKENKYIVDRNLKSYWKFYLE